MKPLFRIAWHFWTNTKYSGEVSSIIPVDIHQELTQCVRTWIFSKCRKHWDFTLCPSSTVANAFKSRQYLQLLEIPKQISCVHKGIKRAIPRKLFKISDCRASSFLKTVPGCRVSRHFLMYRSNRSFNMPPLGIPRAFDIFAVPGRREFDYQSLLGGGEFDPHALGVGNLNCTLDFM